MGTASALVFLVLVMMFVLWFYGPWQSLCVDWARERMFAARNVIFDLGTDGKLYFNSQEYRELRYRIEGTIRFCHRISWPTLVVLSSSKRFISVPQRPKMSELIAKFADKEVHAIVQKEVDEIAWIIVRVMIFRSILLMMIFAVAWTASRCIGPIYRLCRSVTDKLVELIQVDALTFDKKAPLLTEDTYVNRKVPV